MTRAEMLRQRRQLRRRIRETLTERRITEAMANVDQERSRAPAAGVPERGNGATAG